MNSELPHLEDPVLNTVRRLLAAEHIRLSRLDLRGAYNEAWHDVYGLLSRGEEVESLRGLLVTVTRRHARHAYQRRRELLGGEAILDQQAEPIGLLDRVADRHTIELLTERLAERLSPSERNAVALCAFYGYSRREAAERLGVRESRLHKTMDSATKRIATLAAEIGIRGCGEEEWSRALAAFALGTIHQDHPDHRRVSAHIEDCPACKRYVRRLQGVTGLLPPSLVPFAPGAGGLFARMHRLGARGPHAPRSASAGASGHAGVFGGGAIVKVAVIVAASAMTAGAVVLHAAPAAHHPLAPRASRLAEPPSTLTAPKLPAKHHRRPMPKRHHHAHHVRGRVPSKTVAPAVSTETAPPPSAVSPQPEQAPAPPESSREETGGSEFGFEGTSGSK